MKGPAFALLISTSPIFLPQDVFHIFKLSRLWLIIINLDGPRYSWPKQQLLAEAPWFSRSSCSSASPTSRCIEGCPPGAGALLGTTLRERSRRSLPPADTATRAPNAKVPFSGSSATILVSARTRPKSLPRRTAFVASTSSPRATRSRFLHLGRSNVRRLSRAETTMRGRWLARLTST